MKRIETKFIEIGEEKLPFRFSFNAFMYYSEIYGKEVSKIKNLKDIRDICFCAYLAGCDYTKNPATITKEDFELLIEDYPLCIQQLSETMTEQMNTKKK